MEDYSISYFIPNELKKKIDTSKEKESRLNFDAKPSNEWDKKMMICIQRKEAPQPLEKKMKMTTKTTSMNICLKEEGDDKHKDIEEEDEEAELDFFFNYEEGPEWGFEEDQLWGYSVECDLLDGGIAPPPPFLGIYYQPDLPSPVDHTSFVTEDRYINPSLVVDRAVHELSALALDKDGLFWTHDGTILNQLHYQQTFPRPSSKAPTSSWTHASRASAVVNMEHTRLVKMLTSDEKWTELFPSIVSVAIRLRFLLRGSSSRNPDGSLQLISTTLQAPTPYVPKRAFTLLRTFKQIDQSTWVVADMSIDRSRNIGYPCGCLIQGLADGFSQVIWVEHLEFEEKYMDNKLYTDLSCRGFAFGAQRWVECLERSCERRSYQTKSGFLVPCSVGQEDPWQYEKKCVMKLSQKMVRDFCLNINPPVSGGDPKLRISCVPALRNMQICCALAQSPYHNDPKEMVLISVTTFSLPHSPEVILGILGDEHRRHEWDVSGKISPLIKPTCYTTGNDSRNKISVYQTYSWFGDQVVLQEASVNRSGSLLVWSVLKSNAFVGIVKCPSRLPVIELSGLAISSCNSHQNTTSSSNTGGGSIVTLAVQQEAYDMKVLEPKTLDFAKKHIMEVAHRVEAVLNPSAPKNSPEGVRPRFKTIHQQIKLTGGSGKA